MILNKQIDILTKAREVKFTIEKVDNLIGQNNIGICPLHEVQDAHTDKKRKVEELLTLIKETDF